MTTTTIGTSMSHVISFRGDQSIRGVTVCDEKIFILRDPSEETIEQYDINAVERLTPIQVNGLCDDGWWLGKTLISCDVNRCLYVNDYRAVFRIDLPTINVVSWRVDGLPRGLSVNGQRNVLVTCFNFDEIREYTPSGTLVKSIQLNVNHVTWPVHSVQLTDGKVVVCHHGPDGVSLVDDRGGVLTSYRNSKTNKLLNEPRYIVVVNDSILVADTDNDRILLFNSSLNFARILPLPVESQLTRPWCVYVDQSRGRMYAGENCAGGRVLIFDNIDFSC